MKSNFKPIRNYQCVCGRIFNKSQAYNGHKCHCKDFQLQKYGNLDNYTKVKENIVTALKKGSKIKSDKQRETRLNKLDRWISERHTCEYCGKTMSEIYGSGRFCSSSCARSFSSNTNRETTNMKISKSVCKTLKDKGKIITKELPKIFCKKCGKQLNPHNKTKYCQECYRKFHTTSEETKKKLSKIQKDLVKSGKHRGWNSRSKIPSTEKQWMKILKENNIPYKHDYNVSKKSIGVSGNGAYKLDFLLSNNIDLEIDSTLHLREDRKNHDKIRDKNLKQAGFKVYRIKCYSNEYKKNISKVINDFIIWYRENI